MIFSHFDYFDELLDAALGAGEASWNHHERVSYVRIKVQFYQYEDTSIEILYTYVCASASRRSLIAARRGVCVCVRVRV